MEYVGGQTLRTRMQLQKFTVDEATEVVRQICEAVEYAHVKGLLHRDIKPENVLFIGDKVTDGIKVADFGIAKIADSRHTKQDLTFTGVTVGTPFYMAPEQSMEGQSDFRADVYSIGVLFYELLTGRLPLGRFESPSSFGRGNRQLDKIVFRSLASEAEQRFQSAQAFRDSLDGVQDSSSRWKPVAMCLLAAGLLAALVTGVILSWPARPVSQHSPAKAPTKLTAPPPLIEEVSNTTSPEFSPVTSEIATPTHEKVTQPVMAETKPKPPSEAENPFNPPTAKTVDNDPKPVAPAATNTPARSVKPNASVNQLMLERVDWSVVPAAEGIAASTNRVVSFPSSLSSSPFHNRLSGIVFDPQRKFAAAIISNPFVKFSQLICVDVASGNIHSSHKLPSKNLPIGVSADGKRIVTFEPGWGRKPGTLSFWNNHNETLELDFSWPTGSSFDRKIILWDIKTATPRYSYPADTKPALSLGANRLAFRHGRAIWIADSADGKILGTIECEPTVSSLALSSSGTKLAGCSGGGDVWIWDLSDGKLANESNTPSGHARSIEWAGDDHVLVDGQYLIDVQLGGLCQGPATGPRAPQKDAEADDA